MIQPPWYALRQEVEMRVTAFMAAVLLWLPGDGLGQTRVDLRSQSKNIDFSDAQSVRPFRTGTSLPAVCTQGEMFFKTDAAPGANVYGCVATDTWSLQSEMDPVTDFESDLQLAANSLTISCRKGNCNVQEGDATQPFSGTTAKFVPSTGSYTAYIYVEGQLLRYGHASGSMATCGGSCVQGITGFPANAVPLFTAVVLNGVFQNGSLVDRRSRYRAPKRAISGPNVVITETANSVVYSSLMTGPLRNQPAGARPGCSAANRGTLWHENGVSGVKDTVAVCAKDASDAYAWRTVY
jgi:hypothetical protein